MTDAVEESKAATEELKPAGRQRSPLERAVVWGGIGLLILLVFFENNSRKKFEAAKQWAMDNEYAKKSLVEVREAFAGARESDHEDPMNEKRDQLAAAEELKQSSVVETEKEFKWPSLFMTWKLVVTFQGVGDEATMIGFYNPADLEAIQEEQKAKFSTEITGEAAPDLGTFGANGPGGSEPGDSDEPPATEESTEEDSEVSNKPDESSEESSDE